MVEDIKAAKTTEKIDEVKALTDIKNVHKDYG